MGVVVAETSLNNYFVPYCSLSRAGFGFGTSQPRLLSKIDTLLKYQFSTPF
jgi:hypothetical protein